MALKFKRSIIIKFTITAILFFLIIKLSDINISKVRHTISQLDIYYLLISFPGVFLILFFKSMRWYFLLKNHKIDFSFRESVQAYFASFAVGVITPGRLGEFLKIYYPRQNPKNNFEVILQSTFTDRFYDLMFLCWVGLAGLLYFLFMVGKYQSIVFSTVVCLIVFVTIFFLLNWLGRFNWYIENRFWQFVHSCFRMFYIKSISIWALTFLSYAIFFATNYYIIKSIGISIPISDVIFIVAISSLIVLLPVSVGGFGTREGTLVYLFGVISLGAESALIYSFIQFIVFFTLGGIIGFAFYAIRPVPLSLIKTDSIKAFQIILKPLQRGRNNTTPSS